MSEDGEENKATFFPYRCVLDVFGNQYIIPLLKTGNKWNVAYTLAEIVEASCGNKQMQAKIDGVHAQLVERCKNERVMTQSFVNDVRDNAKETFLEDWNDYRMSNGKNAVDASFLPRFVTTYESLKNNPEMLAKLVDNAKEVKQKV